MLTIFQDCSGLISPLSVPYQPCKGTTVNNIHVTDRSSIIHVSCWADLLVVLSHHLHMCKDVTIDVKTFIQKGNGSDCLSFIQPYCLPLCIFSIETNSVVVLKLQFSRLHFIGTWRNRYQSRYGSLAKDDKTDGQEHQRVSGAPPAIIHIDMASVLNMHW